MRKSLAAATMAASITLGGAAGVAIFTPAISGAETSDPGSDAQPGSVTSDDAAQRDGSRHLAEVLAPLVEDGTLTQAQADAVIAALEEAGPPRGRGPHLRAFVGDAISDTLGLTSEEIRSRLSDGASLADIAAEEGVDVQTLVDAIVAEITAHVGQEVTDGEITQEQADERLAEVEEHVADMVSASGGEFRGPGPGRGPGGAPHHHDGGAQSDADDAEETAA